MIKIKILLLVLFTFPLYSCDEELTEADICFYKVWPKLDYLDEEDYNALQKIKDKAFLDFGQDKIDSIYSVQDKEYLFLAAECGHLRKHIKTLNRNAFYFIPIPSSLFIEMFDQKHELKPGKIMKIN
jgi:hypothetical protein